MSLAETSTSGNVATRFQAGKSGNPGGFPQSKRKLSKRFLDALLEHFEENGPDAIERYCQDNLAGYIALIAGMVPTESTVNVNNSTDVSPGLERLSSNLEWLSQHVERVRKDREATISQPERPLLPAPLHPEKS